MKHRTANNLLLALTAFIWGSAFVAQSVGMDHVGPFTFNSIRSFMGGIVLLPVILILRRQSGRTNKNEKTVYYCGSEEYAVGSHWRQPVLSSRSD